MVEEGRFGAANRINNKRYLTFGRFWRWASASVSSVPFSFRSGDRGRCVLVRVCESVRVDEETETLREIYSSVSYISIRK